MFSPAISNPRRDHALVATQRSKIRMLWREMGTVGAVRFKRNGAPEPIRAERQLYFIPVNHHQKRSG